MFHKKVDESNVKPCSHMETLVSAHVDGKLSGVQKWYTETHIAGCKQCQASVPFLQALRSRTLMLGAEDINENAAQECHLAQDRWVNIEKEWDETDGATKEQPLN
jgi:anti-sigma factor RsiW